MMVVAGRTDPWCHAASDLRSGWTSAVGRAGRLPLHEPWTERALGLAIATNAQPRSSSVRLPHLAIRYRHKSTRP